MNLLRAIFRTRTSRIAAVALLVVALDQFTKALVLKYLGFDPDYMGGKVIIPGFFKLVHFENTGAAWSLLRGNNKLLAGVAVLALVVLFLGRHHFNSRKRLGQVALGLIFGGIIGNLIDRLHYGHVVDFLYFYLQIGDRIHDFPAFNIADSAICTGVGLIFLMTWKNESQPQANGTPPPAKDSEQLPPAAEPRPRDV